MQDAPNNSPLLRALTAVLVVFVFSMRGGSAFYPAKAMRAAMRVRNVPGFRNFSVGFRVARDSTPAMRRHDKPMEPHHANA